jgi:hypothetical protein
MLVKILCSGCVEDLIPEVAWSMVANGLAEVPKPKQVDSDVPIQVNSALVVEAAALEIPFNGMAARPAFKRSPKSRKRLVEIANAAMSN